MSLYIPPLSCVSLSRRSEELSNYERNHLDNLLKTLGKRREEDFEIFDKEAKRFLIRVNKESMENPNDGRRIITFKRLNKILSISNPCIRDVFTTDVISGLIKITNFNETINLGLLEEIMAVLVFTETSYVALLPYSENNREINCFQLGQFIIATFIPKMVQNIPEKPEYYGAFAAAVIFFLLDARRREIISIQDILASQLLVHLQTCISYENGNYKGEPAFDYFTVATFQEVISEFRTLDEDLNGTLSLDEMFMFRRAYFNKLFIERVFAISHTYDGDLDFKGFVDLCCAVKFKDTKAAARYYFEAIDLNNDGFVDQQEIREYSTMLFDFITDSIEVPPDVICAELVDMMDGKSRMNIEEFTNCRMRAVFCGFITNYYDWLRYEKRES